MDQQGRRIWSFLERTWKRVELVSLQPWLECRGEAFLRFEGQLVRPDKGLALFKGKFVFCVYPAGDGMRFDAQAEPFLDYSSKINLHDWLDGYPEVRHDSLALGRLEVPVRVAVLDGLFAFGELPETVLGISYFERRASGLFY